MIKIFGINEDCEGFKKLMEYLKDRGHFYTIHDGLVQEDINVLEINADYCNFTPIIWAVFHSLEQGDYSYIKIE